MTELAAKYLAGIATAATKTTTTTTTGVKAITDSLCAVQSEFVYIGVCFELNCFQSIFFLFVGKNSR